MLQKSIQWAKENCDSVCNALGIEYIPGLSSSINRGNLSESCPFPQMPDPHWRLMLLIWYNTMIASGNRDMKPGPKDFTEQNYEEYKRHFPAV